jgi:tellurite resistance protein TehA-like permease
VDRVPPRLLSAFSSEWFSVALGTTATSVAIYWMSALYRLPILRWVGLAFLIIGTASFAAISVLWAARGLAFPHIIGSDSRDLNRVSFTAVMPLEMIALGTALQLYLGTPRSSSRITSPRSPHPCPSACWRAISSTRRGRSPGVS